MKQAEADAAVALIAAADALNTAQANYQAAFQIWQAAHQAVIDAGC